MQALAGSLVKTSCFYLFFLPRKPALLLTSEHSEEQMTDINRYKNVSLNINTYNKLKDLSAINETPVSKSGLVSYLVDKEWTNRLMPQKQTSFISKLFSRSSSEGKSNDS